MLRWIFLTVIAAIAAFVGYVATLPNDFIVERTANIAAPPTVVFAQVNTLKKWEAWSPWAKLDPDMKMEFEGPESGVGAISKWSGNDKVGQGAMAIVESEADKRVKYRLDFVKPWTGTADGEFLIEPDENETGVTWSMRGTHTFMEKAVCLFMNMDAEVGGDFEKGLDNLKRVAEAAAASSPAPAAAPPTTPAADQPATATPQPAAP